jgi:ABC-type nickel/cobalt efflux system permease component RcnA
MSGHKATRVFSLAMVLWSWLASPLVSAAHPMGNFSISHYAGIRVAPGFIELRYIIDAAEIPTYQEVQATGIVPREGDASLPAYLEKKATLLAAGLTLEVDGQPLTLELVSQNIIFPAGAGGLPTMKLGFVFRAVLPALAPGAPSAVHYRDNNFAGHAGWKEIVVAAESGVTLTASSALTTDRSTQLSNYPTDLLNSPPQNLDATFSFFPAFPAAKIATPAADLPRTPVHAAASATRNPTLPQRPSAAAARASESPVVDSSKSPGGDAVPPSLRANQQATPRSRFTELVSARNLSFWFMFSAALIAAGLGALHALEPGHGKTIVAAYLVGSRGTARHAVFLGIIVTAAHTAGVYLLGAITLYASKYIVPDELYPWLGIISGMIIAVLAAYMIIRAWTGEDGDHGHEIGSAHSHWFAGLGRRRRPAPDEFGSLPNLVSTGPAGKSVSLAQLLTLGITGGMVPCPAALVVLLGAVSLHRIGFGLFLIVAFSVGLAAVLIAIGLLMVYAGQFLARSKSNDSVVKRWLPLASAACMFLLGLGITARAFMTTGIGSSFLAQAKLSSFVGIVLLGLFLGMRHSTDPDHVVAVSTIVSRERSVGQGALIGVLWGVGHTLTIFLVGSGIILFGLVIPPRVGLSMEFSVALMLILLGVLNLTGALRWLTKRFAPLEGGKRSGTANFGPAANPAEGSPGGPLERLMARYGAYQVFRPLLIGLVHGLAGSAAVALLVLSTIRTPLWAIAYLLVFGIGTILGMMLMTTVIAMPVSYSGKHFAAAAAYLSPISGMVSTAFGLFLVYQIGFVDGLFRANVHWTPQ